MHVCTRFCLGLLFVFAAVVPLGAQLAGADDQTITLAVDASDVAHGVVRAHESIPGVTGEVKLVYPKWIPGTHGPNGPIADLVGIAITSGGQPVAWRRDRVDLYSIYADVPQGKSGLEVSYAYVNGTGRLSTPNMMSLSWSRITLTPFVENYAAQVIAPSITLPSADWQYATALDTGSQSGATVSFKPVSLEQLIDSPIDAGVNVKKIDLGSITGVPVNIAIFADTPEQLAIPDKRVAYWKNLVNQMGALYGARHFNHYTFLLTVSDVLGGSGLEHHQSSDNGSSGDALISERGFVGSLGDLLGHEFNHSWNGKYRRPAGLATPNLQVPMQDELLWVYEGMTQFYGELQTERSGSWTKAQWLDSLTNEYAGLDSSTGRKTRPLLDTAVASSILRGSSRAFSSARRSQDYYTESNLMWLEADVKIRQLSGGKKSIDDFARAFFGAPDSGPIVLPYTRADVISALNAVQPYDWVGFFQTRVDQLAPHPPNPFEPGGYRVVYKAKPNEFSAISRRGVGLNARYSLGFIAGGKGAIIDVIEGSPAAKAGIGPGMTIVGINGRTLEDSAQDQLDAALKSAQTSGTTRMLVSTGGTYREITITYNGGPRYPNLERIPNTPDILSEIAKPKPVK